MSDPTGANLTDIQAATLDGTDPSRAETRLGARVKALRADVDANTNPLIANRKDVAIMDDDSASSTGTPLMAAQAVFFGFGELWSANAGTSPSTFASTDLEDEWVVQYDADPVNNKSAAQVFLDEDAPDGKRLLANMPTGNDVLIPGSKGRLLAVTHDTAAATKGVAVYFDDNGVALDARVVFTSPTNADADVQTDATRALLAQITA